MLDAYIIEQLQRERERTRSSYIPLHIEPPRAPQHAPRHREEEEREEVSSHGVVIIDYFSDDDD